MSNEDTTKQHRGLARCRDGHGWPCLWWIESSGTGKQYRADRKVDPSHCPAKGCGKKWETITAAVESKP